MPMPGNEGGGEMTDNGFLHEVWMEVSGVTGGGNSTDSGAIPVDLWTLSRTSGLVIGVLVFSSMMQLGLTRDIFIASLRALVQLSVLGVVLVPIFQHATWWIIALYVLAMATVAAHSASQRPRYCYPGILVTMCCAAWTAPVMMMAVTAGLVLEVQPLWEPQYAIPLAGMALGNTVTALSLSMDSLLKALKEGREKIEVLLAAGASRSEACSEAVREAVSVAMTPTINNLTVIGVVSIPGMMTGQIIGGNSPAAAAKYQFIAMCMILASCMVSAALICLLAVSALVTSEGFILAHNITRRPPAASDLLGRLRRSAAGCWSAVVACGCCWSRRQGERQNDLSRPLTEDAA